ncbi:MAG: hypothetical protein IKA60_03385 [Rikenellaceae bacterium]|nr:hypothetical protein [Rikenellaceae bacterium]
MLRDAIYIDGKVVRQVEGSDDWQLLDSPYVYRTVRVINGHIERPAEELQDLCGGFHALFERTPDLTAKQLDEAVVTTLTRNHYINRAANAEVRLHNRGGQWAMVIVPGALLDGERYDSAVIRPSGHTFNCELPYPEHFTSLLKHTLALHKKGQREMTLLRHNGDIVSCEGFPIYGVLQDVIYSYTPWNSVESRRAEALFARSGREVVAGTLNEKNAEQPEEIFVFTTNSLVSLAHLDGRPLVPFTAYTLGRTLQRM